MFFFTKKPISILDILSLTLLSFMVYVGICFYYVTYSPLEVKVIRATVYADDSKGTFKETAVPDENVEIILSNVTREDVIEVEYEAILHKEATLESARYLFLKRESDEKYYLLSQTTGRFVDSSMLEKKRIVIVNYQIPLYVEKSCGFELVSKNSFQYKGNIVSYFKPKTVYAPTVKLCIS